MFNPISAALTAVELQKLLQRGKQEENEASEALLALARSSGYTSMSQGLREVLTFAMGYFAKCAEQEDAIGETALIYCAVCANIANGHIRI